MTERLTPNAGSGAVSADIAEIDALFRRVDFAADCPDLAERLREKIWARLPRWGQGREMAEEERELTEDELSGLAAAGVPATLREVWQKLEAGRP